MEPSDTMEWIEAATEADFDTTDRKLVDLGELDQVALLKVDGEYHAVGAWCSHQRASILHGPVNNGEIMCPLHGARFDLKTGKNLSLPAVRPIPVYEVKVEDGKVYLKK